MHRIFRFRRHPGIRRAVPRGNPRHRRPVPAGVHAGQQLELFLHGERLQGPVNLFGIEFHPHPESRGGMPGNTVRLQGLIPQITDSGAPVPVPEFRQPIVDSLCCPADAKRPWQADASSVLPAYLRLLPLPGGNLPDESLRRLTGQLGKPEIRRQSFHAWLCLQIRL